MDAIGEVSFNVPLQLSLKIIYNLEMIEIPKKVRCEKVSTVGLTPTVWSIYIQPWMQVSSHFSRLNLASCELLL